MAYNNNSGYEQLQNPYGASANPYGQQGNPYGSYGGGGNPYGQQSNPYGQPQQQQQQQQPGSYNQGNYNQGGYGANTQNYSQRPDLQQQSSSRYDDSSRYDEESAAGGYEMSNMGSRDPNRIISEVQNINSAANDIEADLQRLAELRRRFFTSTDTSPNNPVFRQIEQLADDTYTRIRALLNRCIKIKQDPQSGNQRNKAGVGKLQRRLEDLNNKFNVMGSEFKREQKEQMTRQMKYIDSEVTEEQIDDAIDRNQFQVFSQSLAQTNRRGEAQTVLQNEKARNAAIQKIEKDMIELARLFEELATTVALQEPAVTQIEQKGEEVTDHVAKANTELDGAVKKARSARKKKWMCLGIVLLIIIIIVVVVVVVVEVTK